MKYLLTIRIPYEALDDVEGRKVARKTLEDIKVPEEAVSKLQKLVDNKEPKGIKL